MDKAIEAAARALAPEMEGGREFDKMPIDRTQLREWARKAMCGFNDATQEDAKEAARAAIAAYLRNVEASERAKTIGADIIFTDGNPDAVDWNESAGQSFKAMCAAKADELEKQNG